jgi:hypothetical protein
VREGIYCTFNRKEISAMHIAKRWRSFNQTGNEKNNFDITKFNPVRSSGFWTE